MAATKPARQDRCNVSACLWMAGYGPSRHSRPFVHGCFRLKQTLEFGRPPRLAGSRSISRPSRHSTEPASGLGPFGSRSLRQKLRRANTTCFYRANNQDWSLVSPACCAMAAASTYIRSSANRLVPKSCILVAVRLQDGWGSSLVRLIRPTRHPQSHIQ
jgi:hypothetical protein